MQLCVRAIAFLLGLGTIAAPIGLALLVAGVEPSRPIRMAWIAPFAFGGLTAALGYLIVALSPTRLAASVWQFRLCAACLMALPCAVAVYLISVTDAGEVVLLCGALLLATAWVLSACVYPAWIADQAGRIDMPA